MTLSNFDPDSTLRLLHKQYNVLMTNSYVGAKIICEEDLEVKLG